MSYTGFGESIVVSSVDRAAADARVQAILKQNAALLKKYEQDVAAYTKAKADRQKTMTEIAAAAKAYTEAVARYEAEVKRVETTNRGAGTSYSGMLAQWQDKKRRYDAVLAERTRLLSQQLAQSQAALKKVTAPSGYNGCVTQAQHDAWVRACAQTPNVTVKGLGALFGLGAGDSAECLWSALPVCVPLPALLPAPGPEPKKPKFLPLPTPPKPLVSRGAPTLPKMPKKPTLIEVPTVVVRDDLPPPPMATEPKSFAVAGLLALVIVGGGAAYYFTHRKKKVAA